MQAPPNFENPAPPTTSAPTTVFTQQEEEEENDHIATTANVFEVEGERHVQKEGEAAVDYSKDPYCNLDLKYENLPPFKSTRSSKQNNRRHKKTESKDSDDDLFMSLDLIKLSNLSKRTRFLPDHHHHQRKSSSNNNQSTQQQEEEESVIIVPLMRSMCWRICNCHCIEALLCPCCLLGRISNSLGLEFTDQDGIRFNRQKFEDKDDSGCYAARPCCWPFACCFFPAPPLLFSSILFWNEVQRIRHVLQIEINLVSYNEDPDLEGSDKRECEERENLSELFNLSEYTFWKQDPKMEDDGDACCCTCCAVAQMSMLLEKYKRHKGGCCIRANFENPFLAATEAEETKKEEERGEGNGTVASAVVPHQMK